MSLVSSHFLILFRSSGRNYDFKDAGFLIQGADFNLTCHGQTDSLIDIDR